MPRSRLSSIVRLSSRSGDRIAEWTIQPLEDRGLEQEIPHALGLAPQDLLDQVVHDVPVVAGEGRDEVGDIRSAPHRECGQLQPRDPAFGPCLQGRRVFGREVEPHHLVEKRGRLIRGEAQVGRPKLGQLAARPEAGQGQDRVGSTGDDQAQIRRQVIDEIGDRVVDGWASITWTSSRTSAISCPSSAMSLIRVARIDSIPGGRAEFEQREGIRADPRPHPLQRGDHVRPEEPGIIVARVERNPSRRCLAALGRCQPFGQQRRLAETRRRGDEGELALGSLVQCSISRGRETRPERHLGMYSLVASSVSPATG